MAVVGTVLKGVRVRVEDAGSVLLVDVTLPPHLTASTLSLDLQEGLLRVIVPKPTDEPHAFDELTEPEGHSELLRHGHIINPNASGV